MEGKNKKLKVLFFIINWEKQYTNKVKRDFLHKSSF